MKKLLILLLLLVSTSVFAEWTRVTESADGDMTTYIDYGTIKKKGHKVKVWNLFDYKTVRIGAANERYLSSVTRFEYDCEEEMVRQLDVHWYSRNMRQGEIVFSYPNVKDEAESVMPGSIGETLFKIACGKK